MQELRDKAKVKAVRVSESTKDNVADLFTKCHPDARFKQLLKLINDRGCIH